MSDPISIEHLVTKAARLKLLEGGQPETDLRIEITHFDDIRVSKHRRYLVKNIIPRSGLVVVWGPPKCGKSFWVYDLMMHVTRGLSYHGRRVQQGAVVYCMFEGQGAADLRAEAYRQARLDGQSPGPFYLEQAPLNLVQDHPALIKAIREKLGEQSPVAIVLDTLNRSLAGSESSDTDMAAYIKAAGAIIGEFKCAVIVVHHCGHNGERPRGHSSLLGAEDAEVMVKKLPDKKTTRAEVMCMKDGSDGDSVTFTLEQVVVGQDEDGEDLSSCVVEMCEGVPTRGAKSRPLSPQDKLALDALDEALLNHGKRVASIQVPAGTMVVLGEHWKAELYSRGLLDRNHSNPTVQFKRLWQRLAAFSLIAQRDDQFWRANANNT